MGQSRRSFLGLGVKGHADSAGVASSPGEVTSTSFVPVLAKSTCNGCDACAKLCPTGALTFRREQAGPGYRLEANLCTGCGDCVDVCDIGAITMVAAGEQGDGWCVALAEHSCRRCGVAFHVPAAQECTDVVCRFCAKRHSSLFQVR